MIEYIYEEEKNRVAAYDGENFVGKATISPSPKMWIIDYVMVEEKYKGKGIAEQLVRKIVDEAVKREIKILPLCPYAKKVFNENNNFNLSL